MKRLTEKDYCGYDIKDRQNFNGYDDEKDCQKIFSCLQKLGKHEDIEHNLGSEIEKVFKALFVGFYGKVGNEIEFFKPSDERRIILDSNGSTEYFGYWSIAVCNVIQSKNCRFTMEDYADYFVSNYGKDWALTKEELEK